jgi:hypothetical protein
MPTQDKFSKYTAEDAKAEKTSDLILMMNADYVEHLIVTERECGRMGMSIEVLELRTMNVVRLCEAEIDTRIPARIV